jgi:hypothetical protein
MRRSISFHEVPASTNDWLFRLIVVLATLVLALALAASALGAKAYCSFEGAFTNGTETQNFNFDIDRGLPRTAPLSL